MHSIEWRRAGHNVRLGAALVTLAVAGVAGGGGGPVAAQVLVNRDAASHTVTVMVKRERRQETLEAGATLRDFCPDGCVIRIDEDDARDFIVEGDEQLSIEEGLVYFDGELKAAPEGGDGGAAAATPGESGGTR